MLTHRPYLSYSAMVLFEYSPKRFADKYLFKSDKKFTSKNMDYGKMMADGLENDEFSGDPVLDMMMTKIPKFELMDKITEDHKKGIEIIYEYDKKQYKAPYIQDGKIKIPLLSKPDTAKADYSGFKEYKTSIRKWTQKMVDESGQITFYATAIWMVTGKIPQDIELVNVQTKYNNDEVVATGNMFVFKTKRNMIDILKMTSRIKKCWKGIIELCEKELI